MKIKLINIKEEWNNLVDITSGEPPNMNYGMAKILGDKINEIIDYINKKD